MTNFCALNYNVEACRLMMCFANSVFCFLGIIVSRHSTCKGCLKQHMQASSLWDATPDGVVSC